MVHAGMAQDPDSTLMGATLILPGSDPLYMSAADARKRPKARH
jgi:hypothetical protein